VRPADLTANSLNGSFLSEVVLKPSKRPNGGNPSGISAVINGWKETTMRIRRLLILAAPAILMAQPQAPNVNDLKTFLGLTDAQVTQLRELRQQERQALRSVVQQVAEKHRALREALQAGSTDATALGQLLVDIQNLRKQIQSTNENFRSQALALLTADQKAKLAQLEAAAKLAPAIRQAAALNLLAPPAGAGFGLGLGRLGLGLGPEAPAAGMMGVGPAMRMRRGR